MTSYSVSPQEAAGELLKRKWARKSLIEFVKYTKPNYQANWHHEKITSALERVASGECTRLIIQAPPRHGKTELASKRFPAWYLGRYPENQVICATYNGDYALDLGRDVRNIMAGRDYVRLFPDGGLRQDSRAADRFNTTQSGAYISAGVGTALTGRGAHLGIIDDPFKDRQEADSERRRETVWKWYTDVFYTRLMPGASIVLMNTRWHEDDLTARILEAAESSGEVWEILDLPAISDDGMALWPEAYPLETLHKIRDTLGPRSWLSLYQQRLTAEDGEYFKREWFRYYREAPKNLNFYLVGDFAISEDGDFTELGVFGVDTLGNVYVVDWWSGQTDASVWTEKIMQLIRDWKPLFFIGENDNIRKTVLPFLRREMRKRRQFVAVETLSSSGSKMMKARSFQAMQSSGVVYWPHTDWAEAAIDQMLKFPAGKHDDKVDVCGVFGRWIDKVWSANPPDPKERTLEDVWDQPMRIIDFERSRDD